MGHLLCRADKLCPGLSCNFHPSRLLKVAGLQELPGGAEFDLAGVVLHVGDLFPGDRNNTLNQWVFLADDSTTATAVDTRQGTEKSVHHRIPLLAVKLSG